MHKWIDAFYFVDLLSVGILLTVIGASAMKRIETCVKAYTINSLFLSILTAVVAFIVGELHLYAAAFITLVVKGVAIPVFISRIVKQMKVTHDTEPYISNPLSLLISTILVAIVYSSLSKGILITGFSKNVLQVSVAVIFIGLLIMITRRKAIVQVIGLLFMENGLFLAGFSLTYGMPTIIELGVLFDMLMGIIILGIFMIQIKKVFSSTDLDNLSNLKG